jgi:hypothetical protein
MEILQYITLAPFERESLSEIFANGRWAEMKIKLISIEMF